MFKRLFYSSGRSYVSNLSKVGSKVQDNAEPQELPEFDIIIVGGGTAGCVLASRLSENPSLRVLMLESGGSGTSLILSRIPVAYPLLFHTKHIYELYTEPQPSADGKSKYWPGGRMLGGCSSVNAQMAQYGSPSDFDEWANIIGNDSWSWGNFKTYFHKFESYISHPQYPLAKTSSKGTNGPMQVGYFNTMSQPSKDFVDACVKLGIPLNQDFTSSEGTRGVHRIMTYMDPVRQRVSSESAFLTKDVLTRPNLVVAIHAHVTRILFKTLDGGDIQAIGVEFASSKDGPRYQARARKEVILSAGAIHTPQLLMLSGVGPADNLAEHKITLVHELPGVGLNLMDHPVVDLYFKDKFNRSPKHIKPQSLIEVLKLGGSAIQYIVTGKGALATNIGESAAFIRSDDPSLFSEVEFPEKLCDSTSGLDGPDLEIFTTPLAYKAGSPPGLVHRDGQSLNDLQNHGAYMFPMHTFSIHAILLRPLSRGSLRIKSAGPWESPIIDPKYLDSQEDVKKLVRGLRMILKLTQVEPLSSNLDHSNTNSELDHDLHSKDDEELEKTVRQRVETLYHPSGTCRMAPRTDGGVVDAGLRVYGIKGLRVCDASIFPTIISGHTAGAVLAIAEKLSDEIKSSYA